MIKEQMNKIKSLIIKNTYENQKGNNDKKKIENLIVFLIILIITLLIMNSILKSEDKKENENIDSEYKQLASKEIKDDIAQNDNLENKIEDILSTMSGVRKSKGFSYIC